VRLPKLESAETLSHLPPDAARNSVWLQLQSPLRDHVDGSQISAGQRPGRKPGSEVRGILVCV